MPGPVNLGGDAAADFAASLAEASTASASEEDTSEPVQSVEASESDTADEAVESDGVDGESESDESDDSEAADEDESDSEGDVDDGEVARELGQLLVDNPKEFFKRTGVDPKVLKINGPKFQAMRAGLKEAKDLRAAATQAQTEVAAERERVNVALAQGKAKYGAFVDLGAALKSGDYLAAKEILEGLAPTGTTFQKIAEGIVLAAKNQSPSEAAYRKLLREQQAKQRQDEEAAAEAKRKAEATSAEQAMAQKNLAGATAKLKGTKFEGIPNAPAILVRLYEENWDAARGGLKATPAQIMALFEKDPVIAQGLELKALKARGGKLPPAKDKNKSGRRDGAGRFLPTGAQSGKVTKQTKEGARAPKVDPEAELRAAMAEAERLERSTSRAAARGKGRR